MDYSKDVEILRLKARGMVDYRYIADVLGQSVSSAAAKCTGYAPWQPGERDRVIEALKNRISEIERGIAVDITALDERLATK